MSNLFVHEHALCDSSQIGKGSRIGAFTHILSSAQVGIECDIGDHVFIENNVVLGDRVTVKCGVQLWDGVTIEDDVFIGPNATFTNDRFPRSKKKPKEFLKTLIRNGASVGANATIMPGVEIGSNAMIGAGAVVTQSIPPNAVVAGNPACIVGYVDAPTQNNVDVFPVSAIDDKKIETVDTGIGGARLYKMPQFSDARGDLSVGEFAKDLPFLPKRYFVVYGVPSRETRGEHTHKSCHQFLVCVAGACSVLLDDGTSRKEYVLDRPTVGIHIPPMVWSTQYKYLPNTVLLVFASESYDAADYIRHYSEFRDATTKK